MATYKRNPGLEELAVLEGEWEMQSREFPEARGRATFEWLEAGAFLVQRQRVPGSEATWIFGSDDPSESQTVLYFDSRSVTRVYHSSLRDDTWSIWREAPGLSQRFTGHIGQGGHAIEGAWESATDGVAWKHDFDLIYRRVRRETGMRDS